MIFSTKKEKKYTFIESGEGHPLVLLHGLMGGLSNFDKMITYFSEEAIKFMFHNFLFMICLVLNTNLTSIAKYVARFIKDKIGKKVTLVGNSMGGHIGLILTLATQNWCILCSYR
jgi:pimeloyl-ACP methyl ester carboxylesterase